MTADPGLPWGIEDVGAPAATVRTYCDPASGRHYAHHPDGTSRWFTAAEEATLAWRASAVATADEPTGDHRPQPRASRTARPMPARHAGTVEGLLGPHRAGPAAPTSRARRFRMKVTPRSRRVVAAAVVTGAAGVLAGLPIGAAVSAGSDRSEQRAVPAGVEVADPRFGTCRLARSAGYGPYRRGADPEYRWYPDGNDDGVVCE